MIEIRHPPTQGVSLTPFGDLAGPVAATLRRVIGDLPLDGLDLTIDLSLVPYIDAFGLDVLATSRRRIRSAGGELRVHSARPAVWWRLDCCGLADQSGREGVGTRVANGHDAA
jgi:anti-anti-sigma factor